jgi:hypothetical protein
LVGPKILDQNRDIVDAAAQTLWAVPRVGTRMAELMETPVMPVVTVVAARWTVLPLAAPAMPSVRLGMGGIALVLMLVVLAIMPLLAAQK